MTLGSAPVAAAADASTVPTGRTKVGPSEIEAPCLEPQPLPPRDQSIASAAELRLGKGVALNPQPLRPREAKVAARQRC